MKEYEFFKLFIKAHTSISKYLLKQIRFSQPYSYIIMYQDRNEYMNAICTYVYSPRLCKDAVIEERLLFKIRLHLN